MLAAPLRDSAAEAPVTGTRTASLHQPDYAISKFDLRDFFGRHGIPPVNAIEGDRYVARLKNDVKITYTLNANLQREMERYLRAMGVDYGALVAIEPSTGRVLALVGYSRRGNDPSRPLPLRASFPAASVFKLLTVSAALQEANITPETRVHFRGSYHSMDRSVLVDNPRRDRNVLTVEEALAKSCNHCFGKLATRWVGARTLENYTDAFGFNTPFQFEMPLEVSRASIPRDPYELARTGAGFGDTFFSPLHAALMAATIANEGRMIEPYVVDRIEDAGGQVLYRPQPRILGTPVTPEVAREINLMMVKTTEIGTCKRTFCDWSERFPMLQVAGKTGTLRGSDPPGNYFWFVGSAPVERPTIAIAALVIARDRFRIKGNDVAKRAFSTYFSEAR